MMAQAKTSEDMSLVNQSNQLDHENILNNWDDYLAPAPMGIAIMSQLLICSTRVTLFKINRKNDKNEIYPEYFCATLVKIANESYEAFLLAHNNMDKIQLQMAQVPDYVKECDKLLQSNKKNAIEKLLPRRLKRIEEAAADGLKYSTQVRDSFFRLGQLIRQVLQDMQDTKGARAEEFEKLNEDRIKEEKKRRDEYIKREQDLLQKEIEGAKEAVQRTQKNSEEASKWKIGDVFTFGITYAVRGATSTSNKKQAENWLQQLKQEAKQLEEEKGKICQDSTKSLKNLQIDVGKELDNDEIIKLLSDGTKQLGELHEKWAKMTMYFDSINNRIANTKTFLEDFVGDAIGAQDDTSLLEYMNESIKKSLESSTKSHRIAATYVKVSNNYIMEPLNCMHGMLSIKSAKEIEEKQKDLLESCTKAIQGIQDMGIEDRNKTIREIENKVQNIQN